jgi:hypothetical protein
MGNWQARHLIYQITKLLNYEIEENPGWSMKPAIAIIREREL